MNDYDIYQMLDKNLMNFKDILNKKTFKCSIFYIKYLEDHNNDNWDNFYEIFKDLSYMEMIQVFTNVNEYINENKEKKLIKLKKR